MTNHPEIVFTIGQQTAQHDPETRRSGVLRCHRPDCTHPDRIEQRAGRADSPGWHADHDHPTGNRKAGELLKRDGRQGSENAGSAGSNQRFRQDNRRFRNPLTLSSAHSAAEQALNLTLNASGPITIPIEKRPEFLRTQLTARPGRSTDFGFARRKHRAWRSGARLVGGEKLPEFDTRLF